MTLLEDHVAAGRRLAMTCLGECYLYGHVGCPQDAAKASPPAHESNVRDAALNGVAD